MNLPIGSNPETSRVAYLDGLRGWAALLVVFHHGIIALDFAVYTGTPADSRAPWDIWVSGTPFLIFASGGSLAVCLFFVLSGFVLAHVYSRSRQTWPALAVRRYVRLGVPVLAGCLFSWMLLALGLMRTEPAASITHSSWLAGQFHQRPDLIVAIAEPLEALLGFPLHFATSYDSSLWTMGIEASGSLVLLTVCIVLRRTGRHAERLAGFTFGLMALFCVGSYLGLFGIGAVLRLSRPERILAMIAARRWRVATVLGAGLIFSTLPYSAVRWPIYNRMADLVSLFVWHTPFWPHSRESFWHGIGAALIFLVVLSSSPMQSFLSQPISRFLGRVSFPLYILHVPLLMVVECHGILLSQQTGFSPVVGELLSLVTFITISLVFAAISAPFIEGGAIALSGWLGDVIDIRTRRAAPAADERAAITAARGSSRPSSH